MEDGTRLYVFSSSGKALGEASGYLAELAFDAPDPAAKAWVEMGAMRYEFDDTVQPQDIRKAWNRFMDYPTTDR